MLWNKDDLASLRLLLLRKSRQQLSSLTLERFSSRLNRKGIPIGRDF
jgi:hypothetical protein